MSARGGGFGGAVCHEVRGNWAEPTWARGSKVRPIRSGVDVGGALILLASLAQGLGARAAERTYSGVLIML